MGKPVSQRGVAGTLANRIVAGMRPVRYPDAEVGPRACTVDRFDVLHCMVLLACGCCAGAVDTPIADTRSLRTRHDLVVQRLSANAIRNPLRCAESPIWREAQVGTAATTPRLEMKCANDAVFAFAHR
jgi:hypothetical protein